MGDVVIKGTVLVVDDDPDIIDFLEAALEDAGYLVLASVGAESLGVAHELHPTRIKLILPRRAQGGVDRC